MKRRKVLIIVLALLMIVQFNYWGIDDCDSCKLGDDKLSANEFLERYNNQCINRKDDILIENLTLPQSTAK